MNFLYEQYDIFHSFIGMKIGVVANARTCRMAMRGLDKAFVTVYIYIHIDIYTHMCRVLKLEL